MLLRKIAALGNFDEPLISCVYFGKLFPLAYISWNHYCSTGHNLENTCPHLLDKIYKENRIPQGEETYTNKNIHICLI